MSRPSNAAAPQSMRRSTSEPAAKEQPSTRPALPPAYTLAGVASGTGHLTRSRPQDSGNEILDNGRPYGTQLSATAPAPARTERAVAALDPAWPLLTGLDAGGEFGRCGLVALLDATVAVRCTPGKKHQ